MLGGKIETLRSITGGRDPPPRIVDKLKRGFAKGRPSEHLLGREMSHNVRVCPRAVSVWRVFFQVFEKRWFNKRLPCGFGGRSVDLASCIVFQKMLRYSAFCPPVTMLTKRGWVSFTRDIARVPPEHPPIVSGAKFPV